MRHRVIIEFETSGELPSDEAGDIEASETLEEAADKLGWMSQTVWGIVDVEVPVKVKVTSDARIGECDE